MFSLFCQEIYIAYYVFTILSGNLSHIMFSLFCQEIGIYCRKSQCLLYTFRNFLWFGILWLGILLLGTLCVRNFVIRNFAPAPWALLCVSSTVQQSVLSSEMSAAACASPGRICSTAACAACARRWPTAACGAPGLSVYKSQCCTETCLSTRAFVCTWGVCRLCIEPVLHLRVSVYKRSVLHLEVSVFKSMCCSCACLSTRALCCTCACVSTRVLCCTWTCLPTRVVEEHSLQHLLVSVSVFFETGLFVSVVSIRVRNTETNRKLIFLVLQNKPKNNRFFSVQNENIFRLFRGHPSWAQGCGSALFFFMRIWSRSRLKNLMRIRIRIQNRGGGGG